MNREPLLRSVGSPPGVVRVGVQFLPECVESVPKFGGNDLGMLLVVPQLNSDHVLVMVRESWIVLFEHQGDPNAEDVARVADASGDQVAVVASATEHQSRRAAGGGHLTQAQPRLTSRRTMPREMSR